jgi:hypothetical protein
MFGLPIAVEISKLPILASQSSTPRQHRRRDQLRIDTNKILTDLVHMLEHLGDIEEKMLLELQMMITDATDVCPVVNAFKETLPANAA